MAASDDVSDARRAPTCQGVACCAASAMQGPVRRPRSSVFFFGFFLPAPFCLLDEAAMLLGTGRWPPYAISLIAWLGFVPSLLPRAQNHQSFSAQALTFRPSLMPVNLTLESARSQTFIRREET